MEKYGKQCGVLGGQSKCGFSYRRAGVQTKHCVFWSSR